MFFLFCLLLLCTLLFSHLQASWIWGEKAEGCNFHCYLPFVKEPFPLSDLKQKESCIGLKSPIHRLKGAHTFCVVQAHLGLSVCAHILFACVLSSRPLWNSEKQKSGWIGSSNRHSVAVKSYTGLVAATALSVKFIFLLHLEMGRSRDRPSECLWCYIYCRLFSEKLPDTFSV